MKEETLRERLIEASIKRKILLKELAELNSVTPASISYYKREKGSC